MSPRPSFSLPRTAVLLTALLAIAAALGGCGSSGSSGTKADPAGAVPALTPLYVGATVTPDGSLKANAQSDAQRLTHSSAPFASLLEVLRAATGAKLDYGKDVKPWLGEHAGLFLDAIDAAGSAKQLSGALSSGLAEGLPGLLGAKGLGGLLRAKGVQGAVVLDTTDPEKARSFLAAHALGAGGRDTTYRGVTYKLAADGSAAGIVNRFAVIGREAALKQVIDTGLGGASLAHAAGYAKLASTATAGALANVYVNPGLLFSSVTNAGANASIVAFARGLLKGVQQAYLSLIPAADSLTLEADYLPAKAPKAAPATTGAEVLAKLPGEAWFAVGIGDLGNLVGHDAAGLRGLAALGSQFDLGPISLKALLGPLSSHDIEPRRDLLSWMGATGIYVSGTGLLELQAALVIASKNPALSRAAVSKLARAYRREGAVAESISIPGTDKAMTIKLKGFPLVLTLAAGQDKFVIGLGQASVTEALNPQSALADSSSYTAASSALGGAKPSVMIDFPTLVGLLDAAGLGQSTGISTLLPYLQALTTLDLGSAQPVAEGTVMRSRVHLGLQPPGTE